MSEHKRIVEINGIKMEVDLRNARRVENFRVGDAVKVLKKKYSDEYASYLGMIVGFDQFEQLPTIIVAYISPEVWETPLLFAYINAKTKDVEICAQDPNDIGIQRGDIVEHFDRQIAKKESETLEIKQKKLYFERMFGKYFENRNQHSA